MQHSITQIGENYENISKKRKDKKLFVAKDFIKFATDNMIKYGVYLEDKLYMVSTWYSGSLIEDYIKTL
jgi:hypothetical protein